MRRSSAKLASPPGVGPSRLTAPGPWFQERADGTFILTYNNTANLQTGALSSLNTDEQGRVPTSTSYFWTGMNNDSTTSSTGTCSSWTSTGSDAAVGVGTVLSSSVSSFCSNSYRLLCLEQ